MNRRAGLSRAGLVGAAIGLAMTAGACATAHRPVAKPTPTPAGGSPAAGVPTAGADPARIDPANFVRTVDNPWFPLVPGQSRVYEGVRDGKAAHEVFMVTAETKTILGVPCVVVRDSLTLDGHPAEQTDDWYAQDRVGNVWYFGEETATLNPDGSVDSREGRFLAGTDGAQAGIYITATPQIGVDFTQELYKGHAEDHFVATGTGASVKVPYGSFTDTLVTKEYTPLEPGAVDHKYYARGIGVVKELAEDGSERLELASLSP